jgi:glycine/D-amino acid oxidase-like deaminating enzyme
VTTGDYMFASNKTDVDAQLDQYLAARMAYSGIVYPTMGNHECTGYTKSNCGPGGTDGAPPNYTEFLARMIQPLGEDRVWYAERFAATDGSWTAKFVFVAANAWSSTQARWLDAVLGEPTTYTFVIRHEPHYSDTAPGVDPSQQIMARHPLTMLLTGHTHSYEHVAAYREIIVGNGGAPLSASTNYGYVIVARQPDGTLQEAEYDYATHAMVDHFTIGPDGAAP